MSLSFIDVSRISACPAGGGTGKQENMGQHGDSTGVFSREQDYKASLVVFIVVVVVCLF